MRIANESASAEAFQVTQQICAERRWAGRLLSLYWRFVFFLTRVIEGLYKQRLPARITAKVLNFGCGNNFIDDAVNSDLMAPHRWIVGRRQPDLYWSGTRSLPFLRGYFTGIVCEHVIEHLFPNQTLTLLTHFRTLLQSSGVLVVSFPDVQRVLAGGLCQGYRSPTVSVNALIYRHGHCFMYDIDLVKELLLQAGFKKVIAGGFSELPLRDFLDAGREPESSYVMAYACSE